MGSTMDESSAVCFRLSFCSNLPDMFVGCLLGMVSSFRGQGEHLFIHTVFITLHGDPSRDGCV